MKPKRVLVTGSRDWMNLEVIRAALNQAWLDLGGPMVVVHGAARGADRIAHRLASVARGVGVEPHPAKWDVYGKPAGMIRNRVMVELGADLCLAFIKDRSPGATACAQLAEHAGIPTRRYLYDSKTDTLKVQSERRLQIQ